MLSLVQLARFYCIWLAKL